MDKFKATYILILCLLIIIFLSSIARNEEKEEHHNMEVHEVKKTISLSVSEMVIKTMLSLPTITSPVSSSYWNKVKTLFNQLQTYLFPPNLDFRVCDQAEANEGGGTGEKVKEAVVKSLGKSKATVEDSAKSAAKMVKKSLSHESGPHKSAEL